MGRRVGKPKALLEVEGKKYLDIAISNCQICDETIVITNSITEDYCEKMGYNSIENLSLDDGMIGSISVGLHAYPDSNHYLIYPVDFPFVKKETVTQLIDVLNDNDAVNCIKPTFKGRSGHPLVLGSCAAKAIREKSNKPLNELLRECESVLLPTEDEGIHININTLDDIKARY